MVELLERCLPTHPKKCPSLLFSALLWAAADCTCFIICARRRGLQQVTDVLMQAAVRRAWR